MANDETRIDVVLVGAPEALADALREELRRMGRADINVATATAEGVPEILNDIAHGDDDCPLCDMAQAAKDTGRSPFVHPSIKMDAEGYVMDKVRHRLFKAPTGDVLFFDQLFHPMEELNLFTAECERGAQGIYKVTPVLDADGNALWQTMDWSDGKRACMLDHVRCTVESVVSGQEASISIISGPTYEEQRALKASQ